jgi:hypothetical protein
MFTPRSGHVVDTKVTESMPLSWVANILRKENVKISNTTGLAERSRDQARPRAIQDVGLVPKRFGGPFDHRGHPIRIPIGPHTVLNDLS